jgi:voltage-gated potassium channel
VQAEERGELKWRQSLQGRTRCWKRSATTTNRTRGGPSLPLRADSLYFTVTALATTGFGDITLPGTIGRLMSVIIMILGATLFVQPGTSPAAADKGALPLPAMCAAPARSGCVHCKACGMVLDIPDEGT